ncbi:putative nucleotide-binding protein [Streptomyces sp. V3I8]|jgi:predicted nucleotide-binding protein|uniref:nucleotide-binding protein n=1 Tax=Streptomyces sp. V3I8 TaxID=3042279 RepID=UPI00278A3223|nr:nucleotide-binding protein [Streptomyces sp. V3I8]MDQ1036481.1 putative nucleotide-binding protein [Streptomyces sp. V3I8]
MSENHTFGENSQIVLGGDNRNFGYNYHASPTPPAAGPRASAQVPADQNQDQNQDHGRSRSVFVVHGRDEEVRQTMFGLLRRLDLRPLEWEELVRATGKAAPFLGDVVMNAPAQAQAALVLLTPDDVAKLHPRLLGNHERDDETQLTGQPRQNVLIELGMVLMAYPARTVIVEVGRLRHVADTAGINVIRFDGSESSLAKIVARLKLAGCQLDDTRPEWRETRHFRNLSAYRRLA